MRVEAVGTSPEPITVSNLQDTQKNGWTCVNWYNTVFEIAARKTSPVFGHVVAGFVSVFTFIPSLTVDLTHAVINLCDRKISRPETPLQNQVSTAVLPASFATDISANSMQSSVGLIPAQKQVPLFDLSTSTTIELSGRLSETTNVTMELPLSVTDQKPLPDSQQYLLQPALTKEAEKDDVPQTSQQSPMFNTINGTSIASYQNEPECKILDCYKYKGFFVKMLVEPDRFSQRISGLTGQERLEKEISELNERGCIQVASVSYISPGLNFQLFRDIGLLLDLNEENDVRSVFRRDVETRILSVDGGACMWSKDKKTFVEYYSLKPTDSNGEFYCFKGKHDQLKKIEELKSEKNKGYGHNECIVKYVKDQIKALIVDTRRYNSENLTLDEILEDCNPIISELKKTLSLDLDVYLYNPETGELARSEKRNT